MHKRIKAAVKRVFTTKVPATKSRINRGAVRTRYRNLYKASK